jgi:hypothetical protein
VSTPTPAYQRLKYRPLPEFAGRQVTIPAFGEIEKTLLHEMAHALSAQFKLESDTTHMARLMAKYGALDLTFVASGSVLTAADTITWDALSKLGLAEREGTLAEEFVWVEQNLRDDVCFLRVFLTWVFPAVAMDHRNEQARAEIAKGVPKHLAHDAALDYLAENIGQRFPLTCTIDDACLTNSKSIWVEAHFYL